MINKKLILGLFVISLAFTATAQDSNTVTYDFSGEEYLFDGSDRVEQVCNGNNVVGDCYINISNGSEYVIDNYVDIENLTNVEFVYKSGGNDFPFIGDTGQGVISFYRDNAVGANNCCRQELATLNNDGNKGININTLIKGNETSGPYPGFFTNFSSYSANVRILEDSWFSLEYKGIRELPRDFDYESEWGAEYQGCGYIADKIIRTEYDAAGDVVRKDVRRDIYIGGGPSGGACGDFFRGPSNQTSLAGFEITESDYQALDYIKLSAGSEETKGPIEQAMMLLIVIMILGVAHQVRGD